MIQYEKIENDGWEDPNPIDLSYREFPTKRSFQYEEKPKEPYFKNPAIAFFVKSLIGYSVFKNMSKETQEFLINQAFQEIKKWKVDTFGSERNYQEWWAKKRGFKTYREYTKRRIKNSGFKDEAEYQRFLYHYKKGHCKTLDEFRESKFEMEYALNEGFGILNNAFAGGIRNKVNQYQCECGKFFRLKKSFIDHQKRCWKKPIVPSSNSASQSDKLEGKNE